MSRETITETFSGKETVQFEFKKDEIHWLNILFQKTIDGQDSEYDLWGDYQYIFEFGTNYSAVVVTCTGDDGEYEYYLNIVGYLNDDMSDVEKITVGGEKGDELTYDEEED